MNQKELREHVRKLCREHGHILIMDCVQVATAERLDELWAKVNHLPELSPNRRGV